MVQARALYWILKDFVLAANYDSAIQFSKRREDI